MKSSVIMIKRKKELIEYALRLKLTNMAECMGTILHEAQETQPTYSEFLFDCLSRELQDKEKTLVSVESRRTPFQIQSGSV